MSEFAKARFDVGQVVKLKSGGPKMTVAFFKAWGDAPGDRRYSCQWFNPKNEVVKEDFPEDSLEIGD